MWDQKRGPRGERSDPEVLELTIIFLPQNIMALTSMPEGITTLITHLHHRLSFITALRASFSMLFSSCHEKDAQKEEVCLTCRRSIESV